MKNRYLSILLIICFIASTGVFLTGCNAQKKANKIGVRYESKYKQLADKYNIQPTNVIDLSDGRKVNFDSSVGPSTPTSTPNFDMQPIQSPIR